MHPYPLLLLLQWLLLLLMRWLLLLLLLLLLLVLLLVLLLLLFLSQPHIPPGRQPQHKQPNGSGLVCSGVVGWRWRAPCSLWAPFRVRLIRLKPWGDVEGSPVPTHTPLLSSIVLCPLFRFAPLSSLPLLLLERSSRYSWLLRSLLLCPPPSQPQHTRGGHWSGSHGFQGSRMDRGG